MVTTSPTRAWSGISNLYRFGSVVPPKTAKTQTKEPPITSLSVKVHMKVILIHWLRDCGHSIPMELIRLIVDTFAYTPEFTVERKSKMELDEAFCTILDRAPKFQYDDSQCTKIHMTVRQSYSIKLVFLGDINVGKQSLLTRYGDDRFYQIPFGADFRDKEITVDGYVCKLQIWNVESFLSRYYENADAVLMVYDITNRDSFERIAHWNEGSQKYGSKLSNKVLIGNKTDLERHRVVSSEEGRKLSMQIGASDHVETSAKMNINVKEVIEIAALRVVQKIQRLKSDTPWIN